MTLCCNKGRSFCKPPQRREVGGKEAEVSPSRTDRKDKRWLLRFKEQLAVSEM